MFDKPDPVQMPEKCKALPPQSPHIIMVLCLDKGTTSSIP